MVSIFAHFTLQELILLRTVVTLGHEVEVFVAVKGLHSRVSLVQTIFSCYFIAAREVINLLESSKITVDVRLDD